MLLIVLFSVMLDRRFLSSEPSPTLHTGRAAALPGRGRPRFRGISSAGGEAPSDTFG